MVLKGNKALRYFKKSLEAPQTPQAPEKQDYLDLAMAAMAIKSNLSYLTMT